MTLIRVTCPSCGDLRLRSAEVTIRTLLGKPGGEYRWNCKCGIVVKTAPEHIISLLRASGVEEEVWELPLELMEHPVDGMLSEDDLIDLELAYKEGTIYERIIQRK